MLKNEEKRIKIINEKFWNSTVLNRIRALKQKGNSVKC